MKASIILLTSVVLFSLASCTGTEPTASATPPRPTGKNPFGVMLPSQLVRSPGGIQVANTLGAFYFRPSSIFLDQWDLTCTECDIAMSAGLKLVLTVRKNCSLPTAPPTDLAAYQRTLSAVLDKYRPVVLLVDLLLYDHYLETGQPEKSKDFADRAFRKIEHDLRPRLNSPEVKKQVNKGEALLSAYRTAGIEHVNYHWYFA